MTIDPFDLTALPENEPIPNPPVLTGISAIAPLLELITDHGLRVARTTYAVALAYGLSERRATQIAAAAIHHDIGKLWLPLELVFSRDSYTADAHFTMQRHASLGAAVMQLVGDASGRLYTQINVCHHHHERWDGSGYPLGLEGRHIPLEARIVALADVLDALTSGRSYKPSWPSDDAAAFIIAGAGSQFDPAVVKAFERVRQRDDVLPLPHASDMQAKARVVFLKAFVLCGGPLRRQDLPEHEVRDLINAVPRLL